jgi:Mrp family chromosome partitioning ATPase/capsular polysaccharide biosynthesis protein
VIETTSFGDRGYLYLRQATKGRSINDTDSSQSNLQHRLHVLWRRKWVILLAVVLVPAAALAYSFHQQARYQASADVLISTQNALESISGTSGLASQDPQRFLDTQALLAREPAVANKVVATRPPGEITADEFLKNSSVAEKTGANLLVFTVTDHVPARAVELAAEYANQYVLFERKLDTRALQTALEKVRARIARLGPTTRNSALYASLSDKEQQLETALTLQTSTASVVRTPVGAVKVQPKPVRNGILGLALGLIIGLALALFRDALDSRARTAGEIGSETGLPLLARIPQPERRLRGKNELLMLSDPFGPDAEAFRTLKANVEFANREAHARMIMVTSAVEQEGKSTTAANLAVAFTRAGARVILVDLDLRRPFLHRFFDHPGGPGVTDVVHGQVELPDALFEVPVTVTPPASRKTAGSAGRRGPRAAALTKLLSLSVLPAGRAPLDPGEFVGTRALADVLADVRERADIVIVDSPPLLHVSDAATLSTVVDAMIVVARIDVVRRNMLSELRRMLAICPAVKLGFVLTGAGREEGAYSYGGYYHRPPSRDEPRSTDSMSQADSTPAESRSRDSSL